MVIPLGNEAKSQIRPWITYLLIAANLVGYGLELVSPLSFSIAYAVTPYEIFHEVDIYESFTYQIETVTNSELSEANATTKQVHQAPGPRPIWLTLFSAQFLHADLIHLAGNMLFLFLFGQKIEEAFGRLHFLGFYLACGVIGWLTQIAVAPDSLTPTLGASGAIAGVMGAYLIWFPRDRLRILVVGILVVMPAAIVIGCWIAIQLVRSFLVAGTGPHQTGDLAYLAHLGGAAAGIGYSMGLWWWNFRGSPDAIL